MVENCNSIEPLGEYDTTQEAGKIYILKQWKYLTVYTRNYLNGSGCYNQDGVRINVEYSDLSHEIDSLEYMLGCLKLCAEYKLPSRQDRDAIIDNVADNDEVLSACDDILYMPQWHDPYFLRLALRAFGTHRIARLMIFLPTAEKEKSSFKLTVGAIATFFFGLLALILVLASPYIISEALISAVKGDTGNTVFMMYLIGFTIYLSLALKKISKKRINKSTANNYDYQFEYDEWNKLKFDKTSWFTLGAGARYYFQEMARKGVHVPPIAIDLCVALEASLYKKVDAKF